MSNHASDSDSENSDGYVVANNPGDDVSLSAEALLQIREWLQPTAYNIAGGEYRKHASSHQPGTGNWLLSSPQYREWLTSGDIGLLWIKGIPGSGKSVMTAKIIADLTASEPKSPVLFFFFRQIITANHAPVMLLRDWMDQLLEHSPPLQRRLYAYVQDGTDRGGVSTDDLWVCLKEAFARLPESVFCVADALDEMDQGNDGFLRALATLGQWKPGRVKVLMTSRPVPSVETPLHMIPCLKIRLEEDEVDNDISLFVRQSLETSRIDRHHWDKITEAVPGRANGLFLYARLAMDAFLEPDADIEEVLSCLPQDLNVLYTSLLDEHTARSGVEPHIQRLILQTVTHTTRPLRLLEMAEMIRHATPDGRVRDLRATKQLIRAACGPLLEILADETVSVIHHSFTEYLKGSTRSAEASGYPILQPGSAHEHLALACLCYLQSGILPGVPERERDNPRDRFLTRDERASVFQSHPFLKYAVNNWYKHVVAAQDASHDCGKIHLEAGRLLEKAEFRQGLALLQTQPKISDATQAHVAAQFGLTDFVKLLVERGDEVDSPDTYGRSPM